MSTLNAQPVVSVGIPAYNRPEWLHRTLECITNQTYKNLEIIISDNCSPDKRVQEVVSEFMKNDSRIKYYRQEENKGSFLNFKFVCEVSTGNYFMWANDDDEWDLKFVETGIKTLMENPGYDAWVCTPDFIDRLSRVIRKYEGFSRFTSTGDKKQDLIRYLREPECMGKTLMVFHGLFKREAVARTNAEYCIFPDILFNLAFLTRYNVIGTDHVMFHKRIARKSVKDEPDKIVPFPVKKYTMRASDIIPCTYNCYKAARNTPYTKLMVLVMISRVPSILFNSMVYYVTKKVKSAGKGLKKL